MACGKLHARAGERLPRDGRAIALVLHNAADYRRAYEGIGDEPCCNATERASDDKLENGRSDERLQQEADADEHWRMNDEDCIGTAIEP